MELKASKQHEEMQSDKTVWIKGIWKHEEMQRDKAV